MGLQCGVVEVGFGTIVRRGFGVVGRFWVRWAVTGCGGGWVLWAMMGFGGVDVGCMVGGEAG